MDRLGRDRASGGDRPGSPADTRISGVRRPYRWLRPAHSLASVSLVVAVGMKYTKNVQIWVLCGPPMVMLGQGIMIYLVDMGDGQHGNEASFIASKVISGIGRALFQTAAQVSVQAVVSRQEVAVATGIFQAANSVGGAIGTRQVP